MWIKSAYFVLAFLTVGSLIVAERGFADEDQERRKIHISTIDTDGNLLSDVFCEVSGLSGDILSEGTTKILGEVKFKISAPSDQIPDTVNIFCEKDSLSGSENGVWLKERGPTKITMVLEEETIQCPQPQGFDIFPDGTVPTGSFADPGQVTTEWEPCGIALLTSTDLGGPQIFSFATIGKSPPNQLAGCCGVDQFFQPIGVEFTRPVSRASITGLGVGCRGLILEGFNSGNVLVASVRVVGSSSGANNVDFLSISGSGIVRLNIRQVFPTLVCDMVIDGYSIDDLTYIFE